MIRLELIPVFLFVSFLAACGPTTKTSGASFIDPSWRGESFRYLIVDADAPNLGERLSIENAAAAALREQGIHAQTSILVIPPTRAHDETTRQRIFMNSGADGVLEIDSARKWTETEYFPGTYLEPRQRSHGRRGHYFYEPAYYDPPMILREPHASYRATLRRLPRYGAVWTGDFEIEGPSYMDFSELGARFGVETVNRLLQDGVIR